MTQCSLDGVGGELVAQRKPEWLARVKKQVCRRFPEMKAVEPSVSSRVLVSKRAASGQMRGNGRRPELHTVTFRKQVRLSDGASSTQIVRVVTNGDGRVLKVTCSR